MDLKTNKRCDYPYCEIKGTYKYEVRLKYLVQFFGDVYFVFLQSINDSGFLQNVEICIVLIRLKESNFYRGGGRV